jgi:hypothetical protein
VKFIIGILYLNWREVRNNPYVKGMCVELYELIVHCHYVITKKHKSKLNKQFHGPDCFFRSFSRNYAYFIQPETHNRIDNNPPLFFIKKPDKSKPRLVWYFFNIYFNIIVSSLLRSFKRSLSFMLSNLNPV